MTLEKNIYIQKNGLLHDFSIHLLPPLNQPNQRSNAYLSLSNCDELLENGNAISVYNRLYFFNTRYDKDRWTFTGTVHWPQPYKEIDCMDFSLTF